MSDKRHHITVDEFAKVSNELVQVARLALAGARKDIELYIRRLCRKLRPSHPQLAKELADLLGHAPTRNSVLRHDSIAAVPVDLDSRLQLARCEFPAVTNVEPIWSNHVQNALNQLLAERDCEAELADANLQPTRSALFIGPPGVGKTLAARWIASKLQWPLLVLDLSAVMSSFLGRTGNNLRNVLDYGRSISCVLLLDEFDAIAKRRDDAVEVGELKRLVTVLLQEIDDWPSNGLLIAATNHPSLLDAAVWRRFEMILELHMPTGEQIHQAVRALLGSSLDRDSSFFTITATALRGLSFGDIERELLRVRREAVVMNRPIEQCIESMVHQRSRDMGREERKEFAKALLQAGQSQRKTHALTGFSRDTLRSMSRRN